MNFCKFCGAPLEVNATFCPKCYRELPQKPPAPEIRPVQSSPSSSRNFFVRYKMPLIVGCVVAITLGIALLFSNNDKCDYPSCRSKAISGFSYCYSHKCDFSECERAAYAYSKYCYSHYKLYDEEATEAKDTVYSYELRVSNVKVYSSDYYTYAEGTVTNNSDTTVTYLKIKGSFKNIYGTVVDTDWTYAAGSEGLAPGESCKWKLTVDKDRTIDDCEVTILDYDY